MVCPARVFAGQFLVMVLLRVYVRRMRFLHYRMRRALVEMVGIDFLLGIDLGQAGDNNENEQLNQLHKNLPHRWCP